MSFIYLKGNCPVCVGARKDCRQSKQTGLIHCRDTEAKPSEYKLIKENSLGFGLWALTSDCEAWADQKRTERREELKRQEKARREAREKELRERAEKALTDIDRDQEIRKILSQLTLTEKNKQQLKKRGLTNHQIEKNGYRSVKQWQKLTSSVSNQLAGVSPWGNSLSNPCDGILCPVLSAEGLFVGLRVYNSSNKQNNVGKYIWLSSAKRGVTNHGRNGENPITVHYPEKYRGANQIGICEGLEFKSAIAANRLGYPVIGFSGSNFGSSPKALAKAIDIIEEKLDLNNPEIVILPDAGAILNQQVLKGYQKGEKALDKLGYKTFYLWWSQVRKVEGDIDEVFLKIIHAANKLTPEEFLNLSQNQAAKNRTWKELTNLTAPPWLEVDTPNLDQIGLEKQLEQGHIYLLKSAKATGKTKMVLPLAQQFTNIYAWFNRIALGREECGKLGIDYKDELDKFPGFIKAGFCANSSYQFTPKNLKNNGLLLCDESDQLLSYLFESICNKDGVRPAILKAFEAQLKAAIAGQGMALFASADNSDIEYEFLKKIAPSGCEVRVIVNYYQPQKGKVDFDISNTPNGSINQLVENLNKGIPCFVIDDIKGGVRGCQSIAEYIRNTLPNLSGKIVEINSDTSSNEEVKEYLKNINEASKETLLLITSPSVISGISIENGHFKQGYGFYNGILTTKESSQSLVRVRGLEQLTVWAAKKGFNWAADRSLTPEGINAYYQRNYSQNSKYLSSFDVDYDPLTDEWNSPWFELYCKYSAYKNLCMADLRSRLWERLEEEGWEVNPVSPEAPIDIEIDLRESWQEINLQQAIAVENANLLSDEELEQLERSKDTPTPSQQLDIKKTILRKQYGEDLINSITYFDKRTKEVLTGYAALYLKDNGGNWYKQLKQLYYLIDQDNAAISSDRRREEQQQFHGSRFAGDISWNERKRRFRQYLGVDRLLNTDWLKPKDLEPLADRAKKNYRQTKDVIGLSIKKIGTGQIYTQLITQLGLQTESKKIKQKSADGEISSIRVKRINPTSWELAQLFVDHQEQIRLQRTTKNPELNKPKIAVPPPQSILSKNKGGVEPTQIHASRELEPDQNLKKTPDQKIVRLPNSDNMTSISTNQLNTTESPLDSEESIADIASQLKLVDYPDDLVALTEIDFYTQTRLNRASRLLSHEQQQKIRSIARSPEYKQLRRLA